MTRRQSVVANSLGVFKVRGLSGGPGVSRRKHRQGFGTVDSRSGYPIIVLKRDQARTSLGCAIRSRSQVARLLIIAKGRALGYL